MDINKQNNLKSTEIDFSALKSKVSYSEAIALLITNIKSANKIVYVSTFTLMLMALMILIASIVSSAANSMAVPLLIIFVVVILILGTLLNNLNELKKSIVVKRFADKNDFIYKESFDPQNAYQGVIFKHGHSRKILQAVQMPQFNNLEMGNYKYETGSGKNRSVYDFGYLRIKLNSYLPHMLLDAKSNNMLKYFGNLPGIIDSDQKLALEGDFNNYFTLYAPKEYETDALYLFTPDVMQTLIESVNNYDIEIIDNQLFLYSNSKIDITDQKIITELLNIANYVIKDLGKQARLYSDDKLAVGESGISHKGKRLQTGNIKIALTMLFIIATTAVFIFNDDNIFFALNILFIVFAIGYYIYKYITH